jgi:hypothetical protein
LSVIDGCKLAVEKLGTHRHVVNHDDNHDDNDDNDDDDDDDDDSRRGHS